MPMEQLGSLGSQIHRVLEEGGAAWGQDPILLGLAPSSLSCPAPQQALLLVSGPTLPSVRNLLASYNTALAPALSEAGSHKA